MAHLNNCARCGACRYSERSWKWPTYWAALGKNYVWV